MYSPKDHLFSIVNLVHLLKLQESCKIAYIHFSATQIFQFKFNEFSSILII